MRSVSRWYGDLVAVNNISLDLGPGVTGLLGPNGAGKSTLLHMMAGLLEPSSGQVHLDGEPAWRNIGLYARLGLVPEREAVYPFLTAWEYVLASARLHRLDHPEAAARTAIDSVELGDAMHRRMGGYSKGMRQRAKIAAALVHDPEILLLDEPFNGTDPRQRLQMAEMLRELGRAGRTIVFSSHILEEVERLAEDVLVIIGGHLAAAGDFRQIRRLMTNRPHAFTIRSSDNRALAAALVNQPHIALVSFGPEHMEVQASDYGAFTEAIAPLIQSSGVRLHELQPADDSLETVFSYLVAR
jgi:ABC-2 type transport system ATP-binding protein